MLNCKTYLRAKKMLASTAEFQDIAASDPVRRSNAGVAQLVEHPICNRAVGSSNLSASTIFLNFFIFFSF